LAFKVELSGILYIKEELRCCSCEYGGVNHHCFICQNKANRGSSRCLQGERCRADPSSLLVGSSLQLSKAAFGVT